MDNNVFINSKTFDIEPNVFACDKLIADSIKILNKKGYITNSSCEGHISFTWHEITNCDLSMLDIASNDERFIVLKVKENSFDYLTRSELTSIYISFEQNYQFKDLPEGFNLEEKDKYLKILNDWVRNLPIKERNDKNE